MTELAKLERISYIIDTGLNNLRAKAEMLAMLDRDIDFEKVDKERNIAIHNLLARVEAILEK